ncbi:MAG: hypothetical protein ACYC9S_12900 [Leptospirales bacterium]
MVDVNDFDLHAAWLRRAQMDLKAFLEALAVRLEQGLPGHVEVKRKREGILAKTRRVRGITIRTDNGHYVLDATTADMQLSRLHEVRGVVVRTELLSLPEWLTGLQEELKRLSGTAQGASDVLHNFLVS